MNWWLSNKFITQSRRTAEKEFAENIPKESNIDVRLEPWLLLLMPKDHIKLLSAIITRTRNHCIWVCFFLVFVQHPWPKWWISHERPSFLQTFSLISTKSYVTCQTLNSKGTKMWHRGKFLLEDKLLTSNNSFVAILQDNNQINTLFHRTTLVMKQAKYCELSWNLTTFSTSSRCTIIQLCLISFT